MVGRYYAPQTLEHIARTVLVRYQQRTGRAITLPLSVEHILDAVFPEELNPPLWDALPEPAGRTVLAGLAPAQRLIVLNDDREQLITGTAGLYNTLLGHELGHWLLHVDRARVDQRPLPGVRYELRFSCVRDDASSWDEKNAHRFMGYLLMPGDLLAPQATALELTGWPAVYRLREQFDVTVTALRIRLEELGLLFVDGVGTFHGTRREALGQQRLL